MAEVKRVIGDLKTFLDTYGVGVRAGAITPQVEDETYIRDLMDLPVMSEATKQSWKASNNVRRPLTIKDNSDE